MTRDDFKALIVAAADPDRAAAAMADLTEKANELFDTVDAYGEKIQQLEGQVSQLRDDNHRLFLRVADAPAEKEEEKELTPEAELENLMKKIMEG